MRPAGAFAAESLPSGALQELPKRAKLKAPETGRDALPKES